MKYKCTQCGKIYKEKTEYCECGNDEFRKMRTAEDRPKDYDNIMPDDIRKEEEGTNPVFAIIFLILLGCAAFFMLNKIRDYDKEPEKEDNYLTAVREQMMSDFDPGRISKPGFCIVAFELNEEGGVVKRRFIQKSESEEMNNEVFMMLKKATMFEKPPKGYTNVPIQIEFGCVTTGQDVKQTDTEITTATEISCYSKNIVGSATK